jgi:hypothetical protein
VRFPNSPLEHRTFFLIDPFTNLLEFKYYAHPEAIFGCQEYAQIGDAQWLKFSNEQGQGPTAVTLPPKP